jgi:hypothetical protein
MSTSTYDNLNPQTLSGWEAYCAAARALARESLASPSKQAAPKAEIADARNR